MENRRPPIQVIVIVLLILAVAGYYAYRTFFVKDDGTLAASGTIETTQVSIGAEIGGKVSEVLVSEGATVKAGDVLFKLDDTLLNAQRTVAAAGVENAKGAAATADSAFATAQAQYEISYSAAMAQDPAQSRTADWLKGQPGEFNVPLWYFGQPEQISAAQAEIDAAQAALDKAQQKLATIQARVSSSDFVTAETNLAVAQARYEVANNLNNRVQNGKSMDDLTKRQLFLLGRDARLQSKGLDSKWVSVSTIDQELRDAAQEIFDDAKSNLKDAQSAYGDALTTEGASDVLKARADVSVAQERYYTAQDYLRSLQTGVNSPAMTAAQKALDQAKAAAAQAHTALSQAQAQVDLLDAQISKLTIVAPSDGVVLTRNVEPGEFVQAGATALTLGNLQALTITVYVPEDRYGEISLGQEATVTVDSFSGKTFSARVVEISNQAEFTPRNVQTVEGRSSTVYAVKLTVSDPNGNLKPGMPADVVFVKSIAK